MNTSQADLSALKIQREPKKKSWFWPVLVLAILSGGIYVYIGKSPALLAREVETTRIQKIVPSEETVLSASGYIVARNKAEISPKAVGRVSWLNLEEGQSVKKGDLVATLEDQEYKAQKAQAEASLQLAKTSLARIQDLHRQGAATRQALDEARTLVLEREAQLAYSRELINNTRIYAPIDGVVTVKKAFLGETVAPQGFGGSGAAGATFAVIVDRSSLEMEADINEQNLHKLNPDLQAFITLDAWPDRRYSARLRQILPTADRQRGTVRIKISLLNLDEKVLPEMACRVTFLPGEASEKSTSPLILIPESSVLNIEGEVGALFLQKEEAVFRPLRVKPARSGFMEILSGASGGEEIVINVKDDYWEKSTAVVRKKDGK